MGLIVWYVVFMIVGDLAACLIGLGVEPRFGSHASLVTFLVLYFMFLWVSWVLAVRVTARRLALSEAASGRPT